MKINKIKTVIEKNPIALATIKGDKPYVIAVAFAKVKNGKIIITNNYMITTLKNLKKNKNVSLVVWNKKWEGYQINGKAEYTLSGKYYEFIKSLKENKNEPCKGAIVVDVKHIKRLN